MNPQDKFDVLGKADLHIHTNFSDANFSVEQLLKYVQKETLLDVIAITDHDTIDGALYAKELLKKRKYRFEIIVGEEISCKEGHLIGLFLKKTIPAGLSAKEAMAEIKKQEGIVLCPHPLRHIRANTGSQNVDGLDFLTLLNNKKQVDALEVVNGTPAVYKDNIRASFFNDTLMLKAEVGGSDAHILEAVAMGFTVFEGKTASDLREAIEDCQTRAIHKHWKAIGLIKYLFFFLPQGLRLFTNTIIHGRRPKRIQMVNIPKKTTKSISQNMQSMANYYLKWLQDRKDEIIRPRK